MAVDEVGTIYVGAVGEFGILKTDSTGIRQYYSLSASLDSSFKGITDIWEISCIADKIYFRSNKYFFVFRRSADGSYHFVKAIISDTQFHRSYLIHNTIFVRQDKRGLYIIDQDTLHLLPYGKEFANLRIYGMLPFKDGRFLIATREKNLFVATRSGFAAMKTSVDDWLIQHQLYYASKLKNGNMVLGTILGGVVELSEDGSFIRRVDKSSGLLDDNIWATYVDHNGILWLAMNNGIARVEIGSPYSRFSELHGLRGTVLSLTRWNNTLYVGTSRGVYRLNRYPSSPEKDVPLSSSQEIWKFEPIAGITAQCWSFVDNEVSLFAGTAQGVFRINGQQAQMVDNRSVRNMMRSKRNPNQVWVGLSDGLALCRIDKEQWVRVEEHRTIKEEVRTIAESLNGDLWLGTRFKGVIHLKREGDSLNWPVTRYDRANGLPIGEMYMYEVDGRPLVGTTSGLFRYDVDHNHFVRETLFGPLLSDSATVVHHFLQHPQFGLWMTAQVGERFEILHAASSSRAISYTVRNPFLRISDFRVNIPYPESGNIIWFGGADGLIRYDGNIQYAWDSQFYALIRKAVVMNDQRQNIPILSDTSQHVMLAHYDNNIRFEFSASSYERDGSNQFQYYLEGFDPGWSEWSTEFRKDYTNLPDGVFRFRVRARNLYEQVSVEDQLRFVIRSPWFKSWWAFGFYTALVFLCIYVIIHYRERRLVLANDNLERIIQQRTAELKQKNVELENLNEKKNEYLGIVAHDLRSPLTTIMGYIDLLIADAETDTFKPKEAVKDLVRISRISHQMSHFIRELLDISAIESGKIRLEVLPDNLGTIIRDAEPLHRRAANQKNIAMDYEYDPTLPDTLMDREKIKSVVDNLINNAIKYTYPGGKVRVYHEVRDQDVVTHVEDTGQGLSDEDKQTVFMSFKRLSAKPTAGESSTGLGLAIVKKIIEIHNGQTLVRSNKGQGSTFSFSLPRADKQSDKNLKVKV
ncbi:MAG TPA: ATP-binding protein [bacterium]|nr:ATP-binding protein [bacterium]